MLYERANKVDNVLGSGAGLDQMPDNLGLVGVAGTLDAEGITKAGTPAPIPGPPNSRPRSSKRRSTRRRAIRRDWSKCRRRRPVAPLLRAQRRGITPPAAKPFDTVKQQVTEDWTRDQRRHIEEEAAAKLLAAVKGGQSLADAATVAGVTMRRTRWSRVRQAEGMPPQLAKGCSG